MHDVIQVDQKKQTCILLTVHKKITGIVIAGVFLLPVWSRQRISKLWTKDVQKVKLQEIILEKSEILLKTGLVFCFLLNQKKIKFFKI